MSTSPGIPPPPLRLGDAGAAGGGLRRVAIRENNPAACLAALIKEECHTCDGNGLRCFSVILGRTRTGQRERPLRTGGGTMRLCTGAIAALILMGSAAAQAQGVYVETPATVYVNPAPPVVVAPPGSVVVAPTAPDYAYAPAPQPGPTVVVDSRTGRSCTVEPSGYRWCWTP